MFMRLLREKQLLCSRKIIFDCENRRRLSNSSELDCIRLSLSLRENNKRINNKMMRQLLMTAVMLVLSISAAAQETEKMIVRLAEIEVHPQHLKEYLELANEVDRLSVEREPGVVCLYPMQSAEDSTMIRILEIYASEEAYQQHQKYKQGTLHMVKDLKLPTMKPLDPETMKLIFKKQR